MSKEKESYRQIFKATSVFGGVQVFNILISVIRSKLIAILLGPAGMGVSGLFLSTTQLISGLTTFGLGTSAIRDISIANESGDTTKVAKVIKIFRRLVWITGMLGLLITFIFAPQISRLTFDNEEYSTAFRILSVTLLFNQLTSGQNVLMQGMRQLRSLAMANAVGSFFGLLVSIPIYYFYGIDGIVPAMVISSLLAVAIEYYFSSKIKIAKVSISSEEIKQVSKSMLSMGIMLSISGIITVASSYIIRVFIGRSGSVDDVGFYTAGFNIINSYVGLVFTAMSTDYFPRLSGVIHNKEQADLTVNQQADLSLLILGPILCGFIVFSHLVISVLYAKPFLVIDQMLQWAAIGIFFKAASWAVSFIFLAKAANKIYFWNELLINIYLLIFSILFYKMMGLKGLGIAFLLSYLLYFIQGYLFANRLYGFQLHKNFYKVFLLQIILAFSCFTVAAFVPGIGKYIFGSLLFLASLALSVRELNKKMQVLDIIKSKLKR